MNLMQLPDGTFITQEPERNKSSKKQSIFHGHFLTAQRILWHLDSTQLIPLKSLKEKEFKDLWIANPFTGESCDSSR